MKTLPAISKTFLSNAALGLVGVALVSTMVMRSSSAAFTGTTGNQGNTWDAGTVTLTDSDNAQAMFAAANLRPTDTGRACIDVTYTGSLTPSAALKLYAAVTDVDGAGTHTGNAAKLSDDLDVVVNIYGANQTCATQTPTKTAIYTGTMLAMPSTYGAGITSGWTPVGGANEKRAFELVYTVNANTANDAQGDGARANFTWEANS